MFVTDYWNGDPVMAVTDTGFRSIVMGFVMFEDGIGWCDDSILQDIPSTNALHQLTGRISFEGGSVYCDGTTFSPIEQGDQEATKAWNFALTQVTEMMSVHDEQEYNIRVAR